MAGVPVMAVRDALRRVAQFQFTRGGFEAALGARGGAAAVFGEMVARGYIVPKGAGGEGEGQYWVATEAGNAFCMAAARTITRATAERLVGELLGRVAALDDPASPYLYRVKSLDAFGSYTRDTPDLGDVDLILVLEPKEKDPDRHNALKSARIRAAMEGGRRFPNIVEELFWPEIEVRQYLRAKSGFLSLHTPEDGVVSRVNRVQLWPLRAGGPRPLAPRRRAAGPSGLTAVQFQALWAVAVGVDPILAVCEAAERRLRLKEDGDDAVLRWPRPWPTLASLVRRRLLSERRGRVEWRPKFVITGAGVDLLRGCAASGAARLPLPFVQGTGAGARGRVDDALEALEGALRKRKVRTK